MPRYSWRSARMILLRSLVSGFGANVPVHSRTDAHLLELPLSYQAVTLAPACDGVDVEIVGKVIEPHVLPVVTSHTKDLGLTDTDVRLTHASFSLAFSSCPRPRTR